MSRIVGIGANVFASLTISIHNLRQATIRDSTEVPTLTTHGLKKDNVILVEVCFSAYLYCAT